MLYSTCTGTWIWPPALSAATGSRPPAIRCGDRRAFRNRRACSSPRSQRADPSTLTALSRRRKREPGYGVLEPMCLDQYHEAYCWISTP